MVGRSVKGLRLDARREAGGSVELADQQLIDKEANATLKLVLSHMEGLASLDPKFACEPYAYEERRQQVMRKIWNLVKLCVRHGH